MTISATSLLLLVTTLGLLVSIYFTAVTLDWMRPDAALIPRFCRLEERTCQTILHTPQARVFGPPNSLVGNFYYAAVAVWSLTRPWPPPWETGLVAASLLAVALGAYLTHALLLRLVVRCPLCLFSHGLNVVLMLLILAITLP